MVDRSDVTAWVETVRAELHEGCGCDEPGDPSKCILLDELAALGSLAAHIETQDRALEMQRKYWGRNIREREAAEHRVEELKVVLRLLAKEEPWATPWPDGAFGLPTNTWGPAPSWVQTMAHCALGEEAQ